MFVADVGVVKREATGALEILQVCFFPIRRIERVETIDDGQLVSAAEQSFSDVRTDEAGPTR